MFRIHREKLPRRAALGHQRRDKELGESVEHIAEDEARDLEEVVGFGLAGVGVGAAGVFGEEVAELGD
jgi:hypothetical protein